MFFGYFAVFLFMRSVRRSVLNIRYLSLNFEHNENQKVTMTISSNLYGYVYPIAAGAVNSMASAKPDPIRVWRHCLRSSRSWNKGKGWGTKAMTTTAARASTTTYIDYWFDSIQKSTAFYENASSGKPRRYFYNIDLQGRLFLEETRPKNIATSIKDERFLDFFFSRIQPITEKETPYLVENDCRYDYPFVSLCGQEINYIRPAATPIVFHSIVASDQNNHQQFDLLFGGKISVPFDQKSLVISRNNGRLYHSLLTSSPSSREVKSKKCQRRDEWRKKLGYGLIKSSVAVSLSERIHHCDFDDKFLYELDDGKQSPIDWLPAHLEPGNWAMPDDLDGLDE